MNTLHRSSTVMRLVRPLACLLGFTSPICCQLEFEHNEASSIEHALQGTYPIPIGSRTAVSSQAAPGEAVLRKDVEFHVDSKDRVVVMVTWNRDLELPEFRTEYAYGEQALMKTTRWALLPTRKLLQETSFKYCGPDSTLEAESLGINHATGTTTITKTTYSEGWEPLVKELTEMRDGTTVRVETTEYGEGRVARFSRRYSETGESEFRAEHTYDDQGRPVIWKRHLLDGREHVDLYSYYPSGRLWRTQRRDSTKTLMSEIIRLHHPSGALHLVSTTKFGASGVAAATWTVAYDDTGKILFGKDTYLADDDACSVSTYSYEYDGRGSWIVQEGLHTGTSSRTGYGQVAESILQRDIEYR